MKIFSGLLIMFSTLSFAWADQCPVLKSHQSYNINQKFFTIGSDFDILALGQSAGKVIQKIFNWGKTFELRNENGQVVAKAKQRVFALSVKIDVTDCNDQPIGSMQENILKSLFKIHTVYSVLDGQGQLIGQSKKLDWFGTDITFYDSSNKQVASLSRPFINWFTDKWVLTLNDGSQIDQRVLFFAAAYKTAADKDRESDSDSGSKK